MITIKYTPQILSPVYNTLPFVVESTNSNKDGFQFVFDIFVNNQRIYRERKPVNPQGYGVFDAHRILENEVFFDLFPLNSGTTSIPNSFVNYNIQYGEEFEFEWDYDDFYFNPGGSFNGFIGLTSFTQNQHYFQVGDVINITQQSFSGSPNFNNGVYTVVETNSPYSVVINTTYDISGTSATISGTSIYADFRKTLFTGVTASTGFYATNSVLDFEDYNDWNANNYITTTTNIGNFFTNMPNNYKVKTNSLGCVNLFNSGNTLTNSTFLQIETDNGKFIKINVSSPNVRFKTYGVFPYNLNNSNLTVGTQPVIDSAVKFYSAYTVSSTSAITSSILTFEVNHECSKYEDQILLFQDKLGSFIPFHFDLVSKENLSKNIKTFKKGVGGFDGTSWKYNLKDRGETIINQDIDKKMKVTSNWVDEKTHDYLSELFESTEVYHFKNNQLLPIIIENTEWEQKKRINDKIFNVEFVFRYAFGVNSIRG
jgi:hypothetical protein